MKNWFVSVITNQFSNKKAIRGKAQGECDVLFFSIIIKPTEVRITSSSVYCLIGDFTHIQQWWRQGRPELHSLTQLWPAEDDPWLYRNQWRCRELNTVLVIQWWVVDHRTCKKDKVQTTSALRCINLFCVFIYVFIWLHLWPQRTFSL